MLVSVGCFNFLLSSFCSLCEDSRSPLVIQGYLLRFLPFFFVLICGQDLLCRDMNDSTKVLYAVLEQFDDNVSLKFVFWIRCLNCAILLSEYIR